MHRGARDGERPPPAGIEAPLKIACVVHRFGADVAGGSEGHCRGVSTQLAARHDVTVLTTCAKDHITWRNQYPAGESIDGPLRVRRFPVVRTRSLRRFNDISDLVFGGGGSEADEERWFRENGPETPALLEFLGRHGADYDRILFWSFRYYHSYFGLPLVADRAVLVPTAENDPVMGLNVVGHLFTRPSGLVFLTPEEQSLVARHCPRPLGPSSVIGTGLEATRPQRRFNPGPLGITTPFVLYLGRVDPNKGCETLLRHFVRWQTGTDLRVPLVLAGPVNMPVPDHPLVKCLGQVDRTLRDALLLNAALLVVPSPFESLSMVLLEAWNYGTAALVNGRCDVLRGQALRADGALYYRNFDEFARALSCLLSRPDVAHQLGRQGLAYVDREYRWPHVIDKLDRLLSALAIR